GHERGTRTWPSSEQEWRIVTNNPISVESAVIFYPRGGSAQVVRYLMKTMKSRGWSATVHAGSLGSEDAVSSAVSFYQGLDVLPLDYGDAQKAFESGGDAMGAGIRQPFHPSYEDRGHCPDLIFSQVSAGTAAHLENSWYAHLAQHRRPKVDVLHLHHLSH